MTGASPSSSSTTASVWRYFARVVGARSGLRQERVDRRGEVDPCCGGEAERWPAAGGCHERCSTARSPRSPGPAPGDFAGNVSSSRTSNAARRRSRPRPASRSVGLGRSTSRGMGPSLREAGNGRWLPERAATGVAGLSCGASGQAVTSRRVIRQAPIRSGSTIQMASEVPACAHWVALMTSSVIWPRARA